MARGGIGSASIVLVFSVLCLTIFSVLSYVTALTETNLIETQVQTVHAYYAADALAEQTLAAVLAAHEVPEQIDGIYISAYWDWNALAEIVSFAVPISETFDLFVQVAITVDDHEIMQWSVYKAGEWEADDRLDVWQGDLEDMFTGW